MSKRAPRLSVASPVLVALVLLASTIYVLALAMGGADLTRIATSAQTGVSVAIHNPRPWLILSLLSGIAGLVGWWRADRGAAVTAARADEGQKKEAEASARAAQELSDAKDRLEHEKGQLLQESEEREAEKDRLQQEKDSLEQERERLEQEKERLEQEQGQLLAEGEQRERQAEQLLKDKGLLLQDSGQRELERDRLEQEKERLELEKAQLLAESEQREAEKERLEQDKAQLQQDYEQRGAEKERLEQDKAQLEQERGQLQQEYEQRGAEKERLEQEKAQLEQERGQLQQENEQREQENERLDQDKAQLEQERGHLQQENEQREQENERLDQDAEQARAEERRAQQRISEVEQTSSEERARNARVERAWRSEREWNRELREQLIRLHREQGALGRFGDIREMVLRLTMTLVGTEKGLMLSHAERATDGKLQLVCAAGFENDPQESAVAQTFAERVMERDTIIREDDSARVDAEKRSPADEEVHNLVAIPIYLQDDFHGVVICLNREGGFEELDDEVLVAVGDHAGAVLENSRLHGDLRSAYLATVRTLADAIEVKDPQLRGHSDLVSDYVMAVADRLDFAPGRREELIFGSLLHDVGKLGISERILLKPGPLSDEERSVIQLHPRIGYHLVRQIPALQSIAPAVLHHHERFDGDGYPGRLRGDQIPLEARIIAVADAFSAMTVERPYSFPKTVPDACAELERCAGGQFDPQVVALFVEEVRRRPPAEGPADLDPGDSELELRRADGEFVLGARSFGVTDSLTLLYSRRHFHETAHAEAQRAALQQHPFVVVMAKLVTLGEINRHRGYAAGDAAVQQVGAAFQAAAGSCDGGAFRAAGCCIGLIMVGSEEAAAAAVDQLERDLAQGPPVALATAVWRPGDSGEAVIDRARADLALARSDKVDA